MSMLANLGRAAAALALTPVAAVADVLTLPASAYNDKHPFARTAATLRRAGECADEATKPQKTG